MGNADSGRIFYNSERVDCSGRIEESDFQAKILSCPSEKDRRVLRGGMTLLGAYPEWVWKDAVVRCIGDDIDYAFCSGSFTNRFVVCFDANDEVKKQCSNAGWRLKIREGIVHFWEALKSLAPIAGPAVLKAIGFR